MRKTALSLVILISAFLFPSVIEVATPPSIAGATPTLSGAKLMYIPNGDFSGVGLGEVGTPPANHDFETAGGMVGTPPTNYTFETGDLTGWTTTGGTPTVLANGPTGYYLELSTNDKVLSSAFTVSADAEVFSFSMAGNTTYNIAVDIKYGSGYSSTSSKTLSCSTSCTAWTVRELDAVAWRGQDIKLELRRVTGTALIDDAAVMSQELVDWTPQDGTAASRGSGGPNGAYATSSKPLTSKAFTVDANAQNGKIETKIESGSFGYDVKVLSGANFGTVTTVYDSATDETSWATRTFGLGPWAGQTIKLQVVPGSSTTVSVDAAGVAENVVPGWSGSGTGAVSLGSAGGVGFLSHVTDVYSGEMDLTFPSMAGTTPVQWFRIVFRMYGNYNAQGSDVGSTLHVAWNGTNVFSAAGKDQGAPYYPTQVWIEKYFWVANFMGTPGKFHLHGWPQPTKPTATYPGGPDVALIEPVDGPPSRGAAGNVRVPPMAFPAGTEPESRPSDATNDPVDVINGEFFAGKTDLALPGKGLSLVWTRSYASNAKSLAPDVVSPMGAKWSHNWQASLKEVDSSHALVRLPMGAGLFFNKSGSTYVGPVGWEGSLVKNVGGDWTLTTKEKLVYAFNSSGQWTSVTDRNGNTTTLSYTAGRLTGITDAGGRSFTISYNGGGRISSVSDGTRSVSYGYNASGDLTTISDVMGGTITYSYAGHLLTQGVDASGNVFVRNTYDQLGRVVQQLDADDGVTTIAYSTPGDGATRVTDQRGKQTTYYFDQKYRITDVVDDDGGVTTTVWDANNNKTSITNALGKTWSYTYDSRHNVLTATDPLGKTWTYTYNTNNDVVTVTDPLSRVTTYGYDGDGNLTSVTDANSKTTSFTVNGDGLVTAITDPLSHTTSFGYDSYGNRTTVTNALSKTWTYTYDGFGRVAAVDDPLGHGPTYTYNAANLVLTATDQLGHVTTYTYDENGNVLTVTDALSNVTTYAYDDRDQLVSITDALSGSWQFTYDAVGNLLSKTNPRGKTTTYSYDDLGRLTSETDPRGEVRTYSYDLAGRLTARLDPKNQQIDYTYNDRNELTRIDYPGLDYVSFAYNDAGARTQMVDGTGTTSYSYDVLYRLTSVTFPGSRTVSYGYDDAGRRTSLTYPGGTNQVSYGYDNANRLTAVTDWNSNATSYGYDDAGRMTTATLPTGTGIVSTYSYDTADRLTGISHVKNGSTTVASVSYTLDDVGNRTQRVDQQGTHTYAYDDLHRLTSVTYPGPSTTSYAFDAFGNRTSMTTAAGTTTYSYDDADRLTQVQPPSPAPSVSYTWDDNGNLTNRGGDTFSWDYEDRMVSATVNSVTTTFAYRGDGLRDSRTVGANTTTFTWDIAAGLPVVLDDGNQYVYGAGLTSMSQSGNWYYYLADGLGSTMAVVDSSGNTQKSYQYDVYGEVTGGSGSLSNEFDFAGQQTDGTGLQYLRARYYDPATGTFLSTDPMVRIPGWKDNPYAYVAGGAPNSSDPTGLCGWKVWECGDDAIEGAMAAGKAAGSAIADGAAWTGDRIAAIAAATAAAAKKFAAFTADGANWMLKQAWIAIRAAANSKLTALALAAATAGGGSCSIGAGAFWVCTGVKVMDSINKGGMTFGNVYILGEKFEPEKLLQPSLNHEMKHADQWALAGLATAGEPLVGQALLAGAHGEEILRTGGSACSNFFEVWAGPSDGGYDC